MPLIIGIEYCKLDSNGRFKLPIAIKKQMEGDDWRFVFTGCLYAPCLELWPYESFRDELEQLHKELNPHSIEDNKMLHILSASNMVEMDSNDRLVIPNEQRGIIKLSKEIVLQSTGRFMEVWDKETYREYNETLANYAEKIDERLGRVKNVPEG